jgi:V8-like Glu-specific endopeptidase
MKMRLILLFILNLSSLHAASIIDKAIYGDDNRRAILEASDFEKKLGRSVLAQVPLYKVKDSSLDTTSFEVQTPASALNICSNEKFANETILSSCTGFLVAPDLLLTAGHCVRDQNDCNRNVWVLDYDVSQSTFAKKQVVSCKKILESNSAADYSLIKLQRPILDRPYLKLRRTGKLNPNSEFIVIGHPLGLPKISTDQAWLRGNLLKKTFTINSDTFSGNSGSPVIDVNSSIVEGILIRGDRDFEMDFNNNCMKSVHCNNNECIGETVLRSISIESSFLH